MKKMILRLLLFLSLPLIAWVILLYVLTTPVNFNYTKHLYTKKENYLQKNEDRKKVVIIGGSNAKFNYSSSVIDSALHHQYLIVNSSVMGNIGFINHAELILPHLKKGDIVILSPEYDMLQTDVGLFGNYQSVQIAPAKSDFYRAIFSNWKRAINFLEQSFSHWKALLEAIVMKKTLTMEVINYVVNEFHTENGEIGKYPEEVTYSDYTITVRKELNPTSIKEICKFEEICKDKGVRFVINLPAVRSSSFVNPFTKDEDYLQFLKSQLCGIEITGAPIQNTYADSLFLDSPYHLNEQGKFLFTHQQLNNGLLSDLQ